MSHVAIAAVLALNGDVTVGERLAAFSLASFANREQRAWPGTRVAAARAGLSRSQYLAARERLTQRGLVVVEEPGGGRGRSPIVLLACAETGPWFEGDINAELAQSGRQVLGDGDGVRATELPGAGRRGQRDRGAERGDKPRVGQGCIR